MRSNTWITRDIVKMMYDRDSIHELAVKRMDTVDKYRKINIITAIIKNRKREYFSEVSNSLRSSPRSLWSELNTTIPKIDIKLIPRDIGAKHLYIYFENVPDVVTSSFTDDNTLLWKGQESIHTFKFNEIQRTDLLRFYTLLSIKHLKIW